MRTLTAREQALRDVRYDAIRAWANDVESWPDTQRLFARIPVDAGAKIARTRQDLIYGAAIVEPSGEKAHHLLNDAVWGYFRNEMRIPPTVFYAKRTSQWAGLYAGTLPTDYRRAIVAADGTIEPELVSDTEIPGDYRNVSDKAIAEFLNASGGMVASLADIPDPYPPLRFDDFAITFATGTRPSPTEMVPIGGKPPLAFEVVEEPANLDAAIVGVDRLAFQRSSAAVGEHTVVVRVTDALGATADATATVTVTAATGD